MHSKLYLPKTFISQIKVVVAVGMVGLVVGCSSSNGPALDGGGGGDGTVPVKLEPFPDPFVVINDPPGCSAITTDQATFSVAGVAAGAILQLAYDLAGGSGPAKKGSVKLAEHWSLKNLALQVGDNVLTVRGRGEANKAYIDTLTITYNPGLSLGAVNVTPSELDPGETAPVLVTVKLEAGELGTGTLEIFSADDAGLVSGSALAVLNDAGKDGDATAGDGTYSGQLAVDTSGEPGERHFRLQVALKPQGGKAYTAASERFSVRVFKPWTKQDGPNLEASMAHVANKYAAYKAQGDRASAFTKLKAELAALAGVENVRIDAENGYSLWWEMTSGITATYADFPPGTKGGAKPGDPTKLRAIILEPFNKEFGAQAEAEPVRQRLKGFRCPRIEPIKVLIDKAVTLEACRQMHDYDLVFIDSHGWVTPANNKYAPSLVFFSIEEAIDMSTIRDHSTQNNKDGRAGRLLVRGSSSTGFHWGVTSRFVEHYNKPFRKGTVVHVGSCGGAMNRTMAEAFVKNGAAAYTGFTNAVSNVYALDIVRTYYDELRKGQSVIRSLLAARQKHGHVDPHGKKTRFVSSLAEDQTDTGMGIACDGYIRMTQTLAFKDTKATTTYTSIEQLEPDPGSPNTQFHIRRARRSCQFNYEQGQYTRNRGSGELDDIYPGFFDWAPDKMHRLTRVQVDRSRNEVEITFVGPFSVMDDGKEGSKDSWVTWQRTEYDSGLGKTKTWTEQGECPSHGGPLPLSSVTNTYKGDKVTIGKDFVEGTVKVSNDRGEGTVEFYFNLLPGE
jgi:hypothetical protein